MNERQKEKMEKRKKWRNREIIIEGNQVSQYTKRKEGREKEMNRQINKERKKERGEKEIKKEERKKSIDR